MINVLYCGNDSAFDGILISLLSITKHYKDKLNVYILTMDLQDKDSKNKPLTKENEKSLRTVITNANYQSILQVIDVTNLFTKELGESVNLCNFYTPFCLLRLFADIIEELPDKILYLDTDTVAADNIQSLYNIDVTNYEFAGCIDYLGRWFIHYDYINSGVMLLNLPMIRETGLFKNSRKMVNTKKMHFPDQTAINTFVTKKIILPAKFNSQRRLTKKTVIRHFCKSLRLLPYVHSINIKPWQVQDVQKKLKTHAFDDILNKYLRYKTNLSTSKVVKKND